MMRTLDARDVTPNVGDTSQMWLDHAVESDAVAFGVFEDGDEPMLTDGGARLEDRTSGCGNAFQYAVEIAFNIEVNQRPTEAGRNAVHLGNRAANATALLVRKHPHLAVFHLESLQRSLECTFVETFCAIEVIDVEFKPIHCIFFCGFAHNFI